MEYLGYVENLKKVKDAFSSGDLDKKLRKGKTVRTLLIGIETVLQSNNDLLKKQMKDVGLLERIKNLSAQLSKTHDHYFIPRGMARDLEMHESCHTVFSCLENMSRGSFKAILVKWSAYLATFGLLALGIGPVFLATALTYITSHKSSLESELDLILDEIEDISTNSTNLMMAHAAAK